MHELAVTCSIVDLVAEAAKGRKVRRVIVEVGKLSGVVPETLAFCFPEVTKGTEFEEANLDIREVDGTARCEVCGHEFPTPSLLTTCSCGSFQFTRLRGEELNIKAIEIEEVI